VVLKSYFDGGNQADSQEYDVLSLAVMSGAQDLWIPFENDWNKVLLNHHAAYLHTTDAVARVGIYEGWTEPQRIASLQTALESPPVTALVPTSQTFGGSMGCFMLLFRLS